MGARVVILWRAVGWLGVLAVCVVSLIPVPPETVEAAGGDKLVHALGYAALAFWFAQLVPAAGRARWLVALGLTALGTGLELVQALVPWRSTEIWDVAADALGAFAGVAAAGFAAARVLDRLRPDPPPGGGSA
jgi:VanZ family protein